MWRIKKLSKMYFPKSLLTSTSFFILLSFGLIFFALFVTFLILYLQKNNDTATAAKTSLLIEKPKSDKSKASTVSPTSEEYVTVHLEGGLGNQLFEIATAYAYGQRSQKKFVIDHNIHQVSANTYMPRPTYFKTMFQWTQHDDTKRDWITYTEPHFHFQEIPDFYGNIELKGYYQSPKYFEEFRQDLVSKLFNENLIASVPLPFLEDIPSVSLHIRRTDYVNNSLMILQPASYYKRAIQHLQSNLKTPIQLIIFSDDMKWAKANVKSFLNTPEDYDTNVFIYFVGDQGEKPTDYQELLLMSTCQHHIITNSSYSWWGAYLDQKPYPITIAPKNWFKHTHQWSDIYCPKWIVL